MMTNYPIIANCNYESATDTTIHQIRLAIDAGLTDDGDLLGAMEILEETCAEHAESYSEAADKACAWAEARVLRAWTNGVREAVESERRRRYRD